MAEVVLAIVQGKTFRRRFIWCEPLPDGTPDLDSPIDLAGYTARFQIRHAGAADADVDLDSAPELTIVTVEGAVDLVIASDVTAALDFGGLGSSARWEIELDSVTDPDPDWGSKRGDVVLVREVVV